MYKSHYNKGFLNIIAALVIGALAVVTGAFIDHKIQPIHTTPVAQKVGAVNYVTGGGTYRLASSISSTQTTIRLSSFKEPVSGTLYTMAYLNASLEYMTLDPQTNNSEFISFTGITQNADGTATLTGVTRGLGRSYPYTSSSVFQLTHSGQSIAILSNAPQIYNDIYSYINNATYAGTVDATTLIKGIVEVATGQEAASSTLIGNTTAPLVLTTAISTSTSPGSGNYIPVTVAGKIDSSFITLASSTIIGSTYAFDIGKHVVVIATTTSTSTIIIPNGIRIVKIEMVGGGGGGGGNGSSGQGGGGGGSAGSYLLKMLDVSGTTSIAVRAGLAGTGGSGVTAGNAASSSVVFIGGTSTTTLIAGGQGNVATGGDLNITGAPGLPVMNGPDGNGSSISYVGGVGASSYFGGGANPPPKCTNGSGDYYNGNSASVYGAGGSGAVSCYGSSGAVTGGSGGQGIVIITY